MFKQAYSTISRCNIGHPKNEKFGIHYVKAKRLFFQMFPAANTLFLQRM